MAQKKEFEIAVEWLEGSDPEPVERASFAEIVINAEQNTTTELQDLFAQTVRPGPRGSAYDLALWLAENWWRLRWEPSNNSVDWRLSHVLASVGNGVAWPNITFSSDGVHILLEARATRGRPEAPVRYIVNTDVQITASAFEAGIDDFVERVQARLSGVKVSESNLRELWQQLLSERGDQERATHRRLEALLSFDPDEAPTSLITLLLEKIREVGQGAVDEVAAAEKKRSADTLERILQVTRRSSTLVHIGSAVDDLRHLSEESLALSELPWERARRLAKQARADWGVSTGPINDERLCDLFGITRRQLRYTPRRELPITAGLRQNGSDSVKVVLEKKGKTSRRFEIVRLVADHIGAPEDDRLLPITNAGTDRQKFQRAFAQEFLLPSEELLARLELQESHGEVDISDDDIESVAKDYIVSPWMVQTTLVNQGRLPRRVLQRHYN